MLGSSYSIIIDTFKTNKCETEVIDSDEPPRAIYATDYTEPFYKGGFYHREITQNTILYGPVITAIEIKCDCWENVWRVKLFFLIEENDTVLFAIEKSLSSLRGDYKEVFNGIYNSINIKAGFKGKIREGIYQDAECRWLKLTYEGIYGTWLGKTMNAHLIINEGMFFPTSCYFTVVNRTLWKRYEIRAKKAFEESKAKAKREAENLGDGL